MFDNYFFIGLILFMIGIMGIVINRKNLIVMIMSIELMLLSINYLLILTSSLTGDLQGHILVIYILCIAAAESAIGLSILVAYYRVRGTVSVQFINLLRG